MVYGLWDRRRTSECGIEFNNIWENEMGVRKSSVDWKGGKTSECEKSRRVLR